MTNLNLWSVCSVLFCLIWLVQGQAPSTQDLNAYLAADKCQQMYRQSYPEVSYQTTNSQKCAQVVPEDRTDGESFDDKTLKIDNITVYTAFQGILTYQDNTPEYCFDQKMKLKTFNMKFNSQTLDTSIRTEFTTCRAGGFHTNGKVFCQPPECSKYQNVPDDIDYFEEELSVTYNMKDHSNSKTDRDIIVTHFHSPKDPRLVYNSTSNTTKMYSTQDFFSLCSSKSGPCYEGKFLGAANLFYSWSGFPQLLMKVEGTRTFIAMRNDPRPFPLIEKQRPRPCMYQTGMSSEICQSPTGTHSWKILWEKPLPYKKEWLPLKWFVRWSYKYDCHIQVSDTESGESLVNYKGPCGRYHDMKSGNYPYPSVGVFSKGIEVPFSMRFRDISLLRSGPVSTGEINVASLALLIISVLFYSLN